MDVLADLLARARARGALFGHWQLRGTWGLEFEDDLPLSLHTVLVGELVVECDGAVVARARQGDILLVRQRGKYRFLHEPGAPIANLSDVLAAGPVPGSTRTYAVGTGEGARTEVMCGAYRFDGGICTSLLESLPDFAVVSSATDRRLATLLTFLADEVRTAEPGQQTVLDRLIDLLLVSALRALWTTEDADAPEWFTALADPAAGPALRALHANPARAWTVAELAAEANLSRAAFARRFAAATGVPPLSYLTTWRMTLAKEALAAGTSTLAVVAQDVGYADEFSFATAFKREVGEPPGRFRDRLLAAA
jgi:AraC-like DNA-binding protein